MQCPSTTKARQWLNSGDIEVQCRFQERHEGKHEAYAQPFPGFANEPVRWETPAPKGEPIGTLGEFEDDLRKLGSDE